MDMNLRLSEHITVHVARALLAITKDVVTLTTTEDVALHMAVEHFDIGLTGLVDRLQRTNRVRRAAGIDGTTTDGGNLTATDKAVTHDTVPHLDIAEVDTAQHIVAATKEIAAVFKSVCATPHIIYPIRIIVDLCLITILHR